MTARSSIMKTNDSEYRMSNDLYRMCIMQNNLKYFCSLSNKTWR